MRGVNKELKQQFTAEASEILAKNLKEVYLDNLVDETCTEDLTERERCAYLNEMRKATIRAAKALGFDYSDLSKPTPLAKRERQFTMPHCRDCVNSTSKHHCTLLLSRYGIAAGAVKPNISGCTGFVPNPVVADRYKDLMKKLEAKKSCTSNRRS